MMKQSPVEAGVPEHPRVPDALARATLFALLESEAVCIALVRAPEWSHVLTSATYERLVGGSSSRPALGRALSDVLGEELAPTSMLERVAASGETLRIANAHVHPHTYVSLNFLRVRQVTAGTDGVLVLVQDVSEQVHEHDVSELFAALAGAITAEREEVAAIRANVMRAATALSADAASIFLLDPNRRQLHGALVGWDWTRTSFVAELERWPNVGEAVVGNQTRYITGASAASAEAEWFEQRGIAASICVPMSGEEGVLGVLFFDFDRLPTPASHLDLRLAKTVADECARLVRRASRYSGGSGRPSGSWAG